MIDTSGHHIVYGELQDYLTGEILQDTDDERIRQDLARFFVKKLGYAKEELEPRLTIVTQFNGIRVESTVELTISLENKRFIILRYGPGSLVTREKAASLIHCTAFPWPLSRTVVMLNCWKRPEEGFWPRA